MIIIIIIRSIFQTDDSKGNSERACWKDTSLKSHAEAECWKTWGPAQGKSELGKWLVTEIALCWCSNHILTWTWRSRGSAGRSCRGPGRREWEWTPRASPSNTGCSLNIVFFPKILNYSGLCPFFPFGVCVRTHTGQEDIQRCSRTGTVRKIRKF